MQIRIAEFRTHTNVYKFVIIKGDGMHAYLGYNIVH